MFFILFLNSFNNSYFGDVIKNSELGGDNLWSYVADLRVQ